MKRFITATILILCSTSFLAAQVQPQVRRAPRRPDPTEQGPKGEAKLRWICKQLDLSDQQMQQVEALIAVYQATLAEDRENPEDLMKRLKDKLAEIRNAEAAGETERAAELREEMRNLSPGNRAENEFFESLEQYLNPQQLAKLPNARQRSETIGSIALRPVYVMRVAFNLNLKPEQTRQLESLLQAFRLDIRQNRPANQEDVTQRVDTLVGQVREILTPEQAEEYDSQIESLRGNTPPSNVLQLPPPSYTASQPKPAEPAEPAAETTAEEDSSSD